MDFIIKLMIIVMACILTFLFSHQRFLNLKVLLYGIIYVFLGIVPIICLCLSVLMLTRINAYKLGIVVLFLFLLLELFVVLLVKNHILSAIRVVEYYIYKKRIFRNGQIQIGRINAIKKLDFYKYDSVYYLVVDLNGKKICSLCFWDNAYKVGDRIEVYSYKKYHYVLI